jgi:hypothetical protein
MPEAVRITSPPAASWMRTADGKTLWTVAARGFRARAGEAPRSGAATMRRPAARAAAPRLE